MKRAYAEIPDGQIHYQYEGSGSVLLLLHHSTGSSDIYSKVAPILAKSYRVIALDILGYGKSDKPPQKYEVADYARSVSSFLKATAIGKASLVGTRFGASIAAEVTISYPEMVDRLILNSFPNFDPEMREKLGKHPMFQPVEVKEDGSHLMRLWEFYKRIVPQGGPEVWHDSTVNALLASPDIFAGEHAIFRYDEERRLPLISRPTLIISGTEDTFYSRLEHTRSLIPGGETRAIEGGDARLTQTMPEKFAQAILDFLKRH
jgi:pimeloyl-ACP methyl ester carboxylesterase